MDDTNTPHTPTTNDETQFITLDASAKQADGPDETLRQPSGTPSGTSALILRRDFLRYSTFAGAGALVASSLIGDGVLAEELSTTAQTVARGAATNAAAETVAVRLSINGSKYGMRVEPRVTVLDLLREQLHLTGTKKGCNHGQCGACTVLVGGRRVNSCLTLACMHDGDEITTVEGLAKGEELHPVQAAFIKHDGFQCGYCTPGQICSAVGMLAEVHAGTASHVTLDVRRAGRVELTDDEIRERMSGNLCRCGAYPGIVAAVREASGSIKASRTVKA